MNNLQLSDVVVSEWVQGDLSSVESLAGSVVLIEVFQVNCPGCFISSLPKAIQLHENYQDKGLKVIALATAFEDYDKNTLENLKKLVETGEVIGETKKALNQYGLLTDNRVQWRLPFAVGMDQVVPDTEPVTDERVMGYIYKILPEFESLPEGQKQAVIDQVKQYMKGKTMVAKTFERFALQGTPSSMLFDRSGQLRDISFGQAEHKQSLIEQCL